MGWPAHSLLDIECAAAEVDGEQDEEEDENHATARHAVVVAGIAQRAVDKRQCVVGVVGDQERRIEPGRGAGRECVQAELVVEQLRHAIGLGPCKEQSVMRAIAFRVIKRTWWLANPCCLWARVRGAVEDRAGRIERPRAPTRACSLEVLHTSHRVGGRIEHPRLKLNLLSSLNDACLTLDFDL